MNKPNLSNKIERFPGLREIACYGLITISLSSTAQSVNSPAKTSPNLVPGQKVLGSDHPELFSRRIALEMMLTLLSIEPDDPLRHQHRVRLIESKRMQLSTADASILENAVETYRIKRNELDARAAAQKAVTGSTFSELNIERKKLVKMTLHQLDKQMSVDGKRGVNLFIDQMIAKSELHQAFDGAKK